MENSQFAEAISLSKTTMPDYNENRQHWRLSAAAYR